MTTYPKWHPGPDEADEISNMASLGSALNDQIWGHLVRDGSSFPGSPSSRYSIVSINHVTNSGMPYFSITWFDGSDQLNLKLRYDSALVGMLDPLTWFPTIFSGIADFNQDDINWSSGGSGIPGLVGLFLAAVNASQLARSPVAGAATEVNYTYGDRAGEVWGVSIYTSYDPNEAEQTEGITRSYHSGIFGATDADDGTAGMLQIPAEQGENYSQTPQVTATSSQSGAEWGDLGDAVDELKPAIDNNTKELQDIEKELKEAGVSGKVDTITHPDDVGEPGDWSANVSTTGAPMFNGVGAITSLIANPTGWALLSSVPALITAAFAAVGTLIATVLSTGWLTSLATSLSSLPNIFVTTASISTATHRVGAATESLEPMLERIAVALEAIAEEVVKDPEDDIAKPGIINVIELASQARAEIEVQTHGTRFIASTGIAFEE